MKSAILWRIFLLARINNHGFIYKFMSKRHSFLSLVPRHVVPDELSLLSVYELVAYLVVLLGAWYLYSKWNEIPVIRQDIYVERLDSLNLRHSSIVMNMEHVLPVSTVFLDNMSLIRINPQFKDSPEYMSIWNGRKELDSLMCIYLEHCPDSLPKPVEPVYYVKHIFYQDNKPFYVADQIIQNSVDVDWKGNCLYQFGHVGTTISRPYQLWHESFLCLPHYNPSSNSTIEAEINSLKTPSFFSLRDISQAYYEYRIFSRTIDTINLTISFKGAVELLPIENEQHSVSGSEISYSVVCPYPDYEKVIRFHANYKDLENSQSRRVFLISSIISGLITVFLAFFIIFVYRAIHGIKERIKENKQHKEGEQVSNKDDIDLMS